MKTRLLGSRASIATFLGGLTLLCAPSWAQLTPDRTYYGVGRPMPMTAKAPEGANGPLSIQMFSPGAKEAMATFSVAPGPIDFAALYSRVWGDGVKQLQFAQLVAGTEPVGPPVVLQPLIDPQSAVLDSQGAPQFRPGDGTSSGFRVYVDQNILLETTAGEIEIRLRPDAAPNTVWNIRELVRGGFYTDILFHRIVPRLKDGNPFVIQVGDPTGTGSGGPGFAFDLENSTLPHDFGVVSMARSGDPNSNGSQVFICLSRAGTAFLDGRYTAFGEVIRGAEAIEKIAATELERERPKDEKNGPRIISAKLVDSAPFGKGPPRVTKPGEAAPAGR